MNRAVNSELLLEFFLTVARCEYALKNTGYFKNLAEDPPKYPPAEPDWDRFAVALQDSFDQAATSELSQACEYILDAPPNSQVIRDGEVAWETPVRPDQESDVDFLMRMVRRIRNNLFHGGKHANSAHESAERTEMLLQCSMVILAACRDLAPEVSAAYEEAEL